MTYVVAFDPGDTTGVAIFKVTGNEAVPVDMGQKSLDDLTAFCLEFKFDGPVTTVIFEKYIVLPHKAKAHIGSRGGAMQAIGMIKMFARRVNAKIIEQRPDQMHIGLKWSGTKMPGTHSQSHQYSAFGHAFFYLHTHGLIKSELQKRMENGKA